MIVKPMDMLGLQAIALLMYYVNSFPIVYVILALEVRTFALEFKAQQPSLLSMFPQMASLNTWLYCVTLRLGNLQKVAAP